MSPSGAHMHHIVTANHEPKAPNTWARPRRPAMTARLRTASRRSLVPRHVGAEPRERTPSTAMVAHSLGHTHRIIHVRPAKRAYAATVAHGLDALWLRRSPSPSSAAAVAAVAKPVRPVARNATAVVTGSTAPVASSSPGPGAAPVPGMRPVPSP